MSLPSHPTSDLSCANATPRDKILPSRINPMSTVTAPPAVFVMQRVAILGNCS